MRRRLTRRQLVHGAALAAAASVVPPAFAQVTDTARVAMADAAAAFLVALPAGSGPRATFPFDHEERLNWGYVPRGRLGIPLKDMSAAVRTAAHELMRASLSAVGYGKAMNIIRLEEVLRQAETFGSLLRDPGQYFVTVFGTPGRSPWGWRMEGHHLSLNFTIVAGKPIAVTPAFMGANPAHVRSGPLDGLRALGREQDFGRALALSLDAGQQRRMLIADRSLGDIVSGPARREGLGAPAGLPLADMTGDQRALAIQLVEEYARTMRREVAEDELRRLREAGIEHVHFAWAGPLAPGEAHYYRLHGPTLVIEFDNTQNDANHIHSVWRDPQNDFGADLLRAHYEHGHRHHA